MWVVETTVIAGVEGEEDESKEEDGWATRQSEGKMNTLNAKSLLPPVQFVCWHKMFWEFLQRFANHTKQERVNFALFHPSCVW